MRLSNLADTQCAHENGVEKAHILLGQSNFELAVKFLDRALETDPGNLEARELLGVAELEEGDPETGRSVSTFSVFVVSHAHKEI